MKKLLETIDKVKEQGSTRPSQEAVVEISKAYLNSTDYEMKVLKTVNGEAVVETVKPVEDFREVLGQVITKAGLDKEDAKKFASEYEFKGTEAKVFAPLANGLILSNLQTGKAYVLANSPELNATLKLKTIGACVKENRNPKTGEAIVSKYAEHQRIGVKSTTPASKKERVK